MRKILFCNIAWMDKYRGINDNDTPVNGGSYVEDTNNAHEAYNFEPMYFTDTEEHTQYCLGFFETKSTNGNNRNQLHIEKIDNNSDKNIESIDNVLVIWCAKSPTNDFTSIVGWYKNATVYREYQSVEFESGYVQDYNILAKAEECVLLPSNIRSRKTMWWVPRVAKKNGPSYGFGQANVWFANEKDNRNKDEYIDKIINLIDNYDGENYMLENS
ncbi:MAG: Nucleotide modification associated domain-containing protein [uncultured Clostridium sp.]